MNLIKNIVSATIFLFFINSVTAQSSGIRTMAEQMPYFAGCDSFENGSESKRYCSNQSLVSFISNNLNYPSSAKGYGIEGTVMVDFVVDEVGNVVMPEVVYDIGGGCGQAALDVLQEMPPWEAGHHDGQPVKVKLTLPIHFSIATAEDDKSDSYQLAWGKLQTQEVTREDLQDNLQAKIYVRDKMGNNVAVDEIIFAYERNDKIATARSRDGITDEMKKLVNKLKKDGTFNVTASVQDDGKFFYINRSYTILE